ncbi:unnamed protein product, partial [Phaeothamnion confervicola]
GGDGRTGNSDVSDSGCAGFGTPGPGGSPARSAHLPGTAGHDADERAAAMRRRLFDTASPLPAPAGSVAPSTARGRRGGGGGSAWPPGEDGSEAEDSDSDEDDGDNDDDKGPAEMGRLDGSGGGAAGRRHSGSHASSTIGSGAHRSRGGGSRGGGSRGLGPGHLSDSEEDDTEAEDDFLDRAVRQAGEDLARRGRPSLVASPASTVAAAVT